MSEAGNDSVPIWWILVFIVLALGLGAIAVLSVGGSLIDPAMLLPLA
ncbi:MULTISPECIES: hypothetical protein [Halobaculum]|uniref:Uncharacterized protein n=2 Tax=Halobaculum TaxID=43927 RepID=A0A8T8WBQ7_9EURY|nr:MULTISPECIES: hypothetical protein [Halobaculum]QZP37251.1 hypothetical protein K6T50_13330 [Halobaculum magnesiiphilum]QZY02252.1 hypothetical protein K6T36_13245 [Halobaculum roseum]